jgi:hypothetical protein
MKKKKLSIKQMILELNQHRGHCRISIEDGKYYESYYSWRWRQIVKVELSARQIIKEYKRIYEYEGYGNGLKKHYHHRTDRQKTKDAIRNESFDSIPQNKPCHKENPWNWD